MGDSLSGLVLQCRQGIADPTIMTPDHTVQISAAVNASFRTEISTRCADEAISVLQSGRNASKKQPIAAAYIAPP